MHTGSDIMIDCNILGEGEIIDGMLHFVCNHLDWVSRYRRSLSQNS